MNLDQFAESGALPAPLSAIGPGSCPPSPTRSAPHKKALSAPEGAVEVRPINDQFYGDRRYGTEDPEGHVWYFATHVRDVAPEDMTPPPGTHA